MYVIYMLTYYIFGIKSSGFHIVNLLFHAGNSVLVFLVVSEIFRKFYNSNLAPYFSPPFIAAILFATNPIHTEPVVWVAGILDLSFTFFYFLSFYLYIRSEDDGVLSKGIYLLSVLSFLFSLFCKEPSITLIVILICYDFILRNQKVYSLQYLKKYVPYFIVFGVYLIARFYALKGFVPVRDDVTLTTYECFINPFFLFLKYLAKLLLPVNLNIWHVFHPMKSLLSLDGIASLIISIVFLWFVYISARKNKVVFLSLIFIVVPLLPTFYIPALTQGIENAFSERYLYLPSFGFALLFALVPRWININKQKWTTIVIVIIMVIIGLYSLATVSRNAVWKNSYTLWSDAVKKSPESSVAHKSLGYALFYAGRAKEGKEQFQIALKLNPDLVNDVINRGIIYSRSGLINKAILEFNTALIFKPESAITHYNLGLAYDSKGWLDAAIEQYQITLMLKPDYADAHNNLGIAYGEKGLIDKAIKHFQEAIRLNPTDTYAYNNLARAYEMKGLGEKAKEQ
ncbi:MAG: hypothetical protein A2W05_09130 [Candidatus Schekmanbacteria bacterium RBG_16_38_10]|uniref:Uncharacterized protein n=1 Tax=Candidatus Schekmanbacteria bacterium RBG_16_38_10 TaxID=1817879 RepID=A0A1F7RTG1_9BACT|nr:MAG: hypothetical protein A2W05_09130 [Candidatus Schekmanbacteria bacterium RBG_16_38_10]